MPTVALATQEFPQHFIEPEDSHEFATGLYPKPDESS
jgi:hypothetical protein